LMESVLAATMGASIIMIDTGRKENIEEIDLILRRERLRHKVKVAFGGNIKIEDLADLKKKPIEIVDIGRTIVDGPLLDLRLDVLREV
jgi:nicotinate-nucleotide pyrophosphorylase (carboxylating)